PIIARTELSLRDAGRAGRGPGPGLSLAGHAEALKIPESDGGSKVARSKVVFASDKPIDNLDDERAALSPIGVDVVSAVAQDAQALVSQLAAADVVVIP